MKKATIIKILSLVLVFVLLAVCVSAVSCSLLDDAEDAFNDIVDDVEKEVEDLTSSLSFEMQNSPNISLCALVIPSAVEPEAPIEPPSTVIQATVLPENAPAEYKMLDWTVYWITNNTGNPYADVTDYVTVNPTSTDTHTATVVCHKYFEGSEIGIKATTRHGDFYAICKVTCQGFPARLDIQASGDEGTRTVEQSYTMQAGKTYTFTITPKNGIGQVGEQFNDLELVSYTERGSVVCEVANMGPTSQSTYALEDGYLPAFLEYSFEGNVLTVTVSDLVEHGSGDRYMKDFCFYYSGIEECTFEFVIKEAESGLVRTLNLKIQTVGTVVELADNTLVF